MTYVDACVAVGVSKQTIFRWYANCRWVCSMSESTLPKMLGTESEPIQVDESYFAGKRKYRKGKCLLGDLRADGEKEAQQEMEYEVLEAGTIDPGDDPGDELKRPVRPSSYGDKIIGPWVVGVYKNKNEFRFFVVPDRKSHTLRAVLKRCCEPGSVIQTDEWKGYSKLSQDGFIHRTVNHSRWFVNPRTGVHTQGIERLWVDAKAVMKRHRHATPLLQSHLDELSWRRRNSDFSCTLVSCFWRDVNAVHGLPSH